MSKSQETLRNRLIADHLAELDYAIEMKRTGTYAVAASTAGTELANGRDKVPIDEYIGMWQDGLVALKAGADPEQYNY
jgi:hypothetical protein